MRVSPFLAAALAAGVASFVHSDRADACGGCFVSAQSRSTQVVGHRMALSISPDQTTLWDQITYVGEPADFGWVLPVKGDVEIGLSSDLLFQVLDAVTAVSVSSPEIQCAPDDGGGPPPDHCSTSSSSSGIGGAGGAGGAGGGDPPVEVVSHEVVGPYEIVQLASDDPAALQAWLGANGYVVPDDVAPLIETYVAEEFDFLAVKLVPGAGVDAMRPLRITVPGASPSLPLRMVAAGTGAMTAVDLWLFGEGRHEPTNFVTFEIAEPDLVWDFDSASSNYKELRQAGFDAAAGAAWLTMAAEPTGTVDLRNLIESLVFSDPAASGYGDAEGVGAMEEATADLDDLLGGLWPAWIHRFYAELARPALATDLLIGPSPEQGAIDRDLRCPNYVGSPCPPGTHPLHPCGSTSGPGASGAGGSGGSIESGAGGAPPAPVGAAGGGGCSTSGGSTSGALVALVALAAFAARRRRAPR